MKKWMMCVFTVCLLAVALSVTAFAADEGIQSVTPVSGKNVTASVNQNKQQFTLTYSGAENGKQYLVVVSSDANKTLNEKTIYYIDQVEAAGNSAAFNVYPKTLSDGTYYVYLSSNAANGVTALEPVATIEAKGPAYMLGDVNDNKRIDTNDAVQILQHLAKLRILTGNSLLAANTNGKGGVDTNDAVQILRYLAKLSSTLS